MPEREPAARERERRIGSAKGSVGDRMGRRSSHTLSALVHGHQIGHLAVQPVRDDRQDLHADGAFALLDVGEVRLAQTRLRR